ncbi:Phosphoglucomutase first 3 domain-containing protein [Penicillium argentinense]|uniref:Phosphoglucomutase first 3 domain-containing protein n=1 Tax=Penicillium argentinense TaxID=1131581 RepID=A0A9W9EJ39_9EURO|nr:Phosphoglucomutase first 3 domain-containing protein [Penicillium argentinense]KAJ5082674.1 Phosphoglucomutase first 3 domain-containing protein [Penicillium argentinense]
MSTDSLQTSLGAHLAYKPQSLKFGTSGRRGLIVDLTQLEIYINVLGELRYLQAKSPADGGIEVGDDFYYAYDLRPSSIHYVEPSRGGLCQAVEQALRDAGMNPISLGAIPTPALTLFALQRAKGSIMVTGSHIPFDRNGYKLNTSKGELMKKDEKPINESVEVVRKSIIEQPFTESLFNEQGMLRNPVSTLVTPVPEGKSEYIQRYLDFFKGDTLEGMKLLVYQHSAVGRDLIVELFRALGAEVLPAGRSETFVPIDTEAIDQAQLDTVQSLVDSTGQTFDAVISTDGDSDRPLLLAPEGGKLRFFSGDLLGMVVADFLGADAVVVPISTNDAIDRGPLAAVLAPKTKIGSPYVIDGMQNAASAGRSRVLGWEANGGFLTGSDIEIDGKKLPALPTRDAVLPLLSVLFASRKRQTTVSGLFESLPARFSRASVIRNFPRPTSAKIVERFSPLKGQALTGENEIYGCQYEDESMVPLNSKGEPIRASISESETRQLAQIRQELQQVFSAEAGFSNIKGTNYTDGVRVTFENGDVAHIRPSGNADELRIYSVSDDKARADEICNQATAEPNGLLRQLERMV